MITLSNQKTYSVLIVNNINLPELTHFYPMQRYVVRHVV